MARPNFFEIIWFLRKSMYVIPVADIATSSTPLNLVLSTSICLIRLATQGCSRHDNISCNISRVAPNASYELQEIKKSLTTI